MKYLTALHPQECSATYVEVHRRVHSPDRLSGLFYRYLVRSNPFWSHFKKSRRCTNAHVNVVLLVRLLLQTTQTLEQCHTKQRGPQQIIQALILYNVNKILRLTI